MNGIRLTQDRFRGMSRSGVFSEACMQHGLAADGCQPSNHTYSLCYSSEVGSGFIHGQSACRMDSAGGIVTLSLSDNMHGKISKHPGTGNPTHGSKVSEH